jgi:hypothetical protein
MVPVLNLWGISHKQQGDIRRFLKKSRIPYTSTPDHVGRRFLFVREQDHARAIQVIRDEFASFAIVEREKWEREWRTTYRGSYWRWLTQRNVGRATMAGLSALWWFGL